MKKILSIITTITLLFAFIVLPVSAEKTQIMDLKQLIEIAKEKLELNTEGYEFNSNYSEYYANGRKAWDLYWYKNTGEGGNMSVAIDAVTGEILRFDSWIPSTSIFRKLPKYTDEEALLTAEIFLNKICPEKIEVSKLVPSTVTNSYSSSNDFYYFSYIRQVNDIDFNNNTITIGIDKNTLNLRSFSVEWDNGIFPDIKDSISKEDAKNIFIKKDGLTLTYQLIYPEPNSKPVAMLVYSLNSNLPIDALTGEFLQNAYYSPTYYGRDAKMGDYALESSAITPYEQKEIDDNGKYITKEQAMDVISSLIADVKDFTLSNASLYSGNNSEDATWNLTWNNNDVESGKYSFVSASINAVTGEINSFNKDNNDIYNPTEKDPKFTEAQGKEIAIEFLKKVQPAKYEMTEYQKNDYSSISEDYIPPVYSYSFNRKENGLDCYFNSFYVNVSAFTGEVVNYSYWWVDVTLPGIDNIITTEKAYEAMFEKSDMVRKYIKQYDYSSGVESSKIKLAYVLDNYNGMIDANSGIIIGNDGKPVKEINNITEFTDISGHEAEKDINDLVSIGVIQMEDSKFSPDSRILQKDFIKMLVTAMEPYYYYPKFAGSDSSDEYDYFYKSAIQKKLITTREKNPDGYINRQEASKMFIKALGFGYIAEKSNMFLMPFNDGKYVLNSYKGYIVLADELGILTAQDKKFNPKQLLTKGESATSIVNFLKVDTSFEN